MESANNSRESIIAPGVANGYNFNANSRKQGKKPNVTKDKTVDDTKGKAVNES